MPTLHERLQTARQRAGMNQTAVARRIGVSREWISIIEAGHKPPGEKTLAALAAAYDLPVEWFTGGTVAEHHKHVRCPSCGAELDVVAVSPRETP